MRFAALFATFVALASSVTRASDVARPTSVVISPHRCYEFPVVIVSAVDHAYPDATCNQLRYPAADCLKSKVTTRVEVVDHQDGSLNCFGAPPTAVFEDVESNYRGQTSLFYAKHQMNVKFRASTSFVGLPEDDAFILNGPFVDCSLLRNHLAHWLFRATGRYSPRTKHVALYRRERPEQQEAMYAGVYLLLEKPTYGPNRGNLAKLDTKCRDVSDLSGGWAWQNDPLSFGAYSPNVVVDQYQNEFGMGERPLLAHPSGDALSQKMRDYFVDTTTGFLPQLYRNLWNNMTNPDSLETHIDLGSYADYLLHTEMSLNVDAYRRSTFFFKDRGQPINAGPVWDLNLAYGNGARRHFTKWIFPQYTYWKRLMCNYKLTSLVIQRWKHLRAGVWSDESIAAFLDAGAAPVARQLQRCKSDWRSDAEQCVSVSTRDCNGTYDERVQELKAAVLNRSHWMDERITELYKPLDADQCSGVGEIPKFNCAADGDDNGCLTAPEKYYAAVAFPPVRQPYAGPSCESKLASIASDYVESANEHSSDDDCWESAGVYVYPEQKGARESNLTHFCNGYGSCPEGPGAKCACRSGILLEQDSCRRIDAEMVLPVPAKAATSASTASQSSTSGPEGAHSSDHTIFTIVAVLFVVGSVGVVAYKVRERARRERLNVYRPVRYGSMEDAQQFVRAAEN
jgi:hypothetical protein